MRNLLRRAVEGWADWASKCPIVNITLSVMVLLLVARFGLSPIVVDLTTSRATPECFTSTFDSAFGPFGLRFDRQTIYVQRGTTVKRQPDGTPHIVFADGSTWTPEMEYDLLDGKKTVHVKMDRYQVKRHPWSRDLNAAPR